MRAREFITENVADSTIPTSDDALSSTFSRSLPATYAISKLPSSDFYKQYRFGVAIAAARSAKQRESDQSSDMAPATAWGENQIVIGYADDTEIIDDALVIIGLKPSDKELLSTKKSEESSDVVSKSPIKGFKGYER